MGVRIVQMTSPDRMYSIEQTSGGVVPHLINDKVGCAEMAQDYWTSLIPNPSYSYALGWPSGPKIVPQEVKQRDPDHH